MAINKKKQKAQPAKSSGAGKWVFLGIIVAIVLILFFTISSKKDQYKSEDVTTLAKCLTEKGTKMYGAFWCPHCGRTKARFGEAFRYIIYIECDPRGDNQQSELCISKQIDKYDTWEFADGTRYVSEPSFELLAERSGCPAPEKK